MLKRLRVKVLIIEDDQQIIDTVSLVLRLVWPDVALFSTPYGKKGIELVERHMPDSILLDLGLPDIDGYEVLKQIRAFTSIPVIVITVRDEEISLIKAFEMNADDYLIKPFRQMELIARLKSAMKKRSFFEEDLTISCNNIHYGSSINEVYIGNIKRELTSTEGRLLYHLLKKAGKIITKVELAEMIWGEFIPGSSENIKNYICRLRKKIEDDPNNPKIIVSRRGIGYTIPLSRNFT
ncbi:two-component system, OmpR family, KDP operon response regulator KdpE [Dehalogenimonas formicexedens]|uniref:Two-component system, OmpR family, KDP operon response regulator KdpE n=2 Tax=Dehalogenimonas TaxID=670486 RepID=A0A1P8F8I1_9CHLR|nr:two-component system, OmpR family, KDP operon response regulator KdpE [Dehalogenimonas formicexedens]KTB48869.1 Response regulators consisting of a CheY-like receiver domain and a winged-helix DNA-binding domain [Dehalogenimonas alkenigignens]